MNTVELYNEGYGINRIGKILGKTQTTVLKELKEANIQIRPGVGSRSSLRLRQNEIRENYFEIIDSEEKAYWLGIMYSDGCIYCSDNRYRIQIAMTDKDVIERFRDLVYPVYKIREELPQSSRKPVYRIIFNSRKMYDDLVNCGVYQNKAKTIKFPELESKFIWAFLTGVLDGDGCVTRSGKYSKVIRWYSASIDFIEGIEKVLQKHNLRYSIEERDSSKRNIKWSKYWSIQVQYKEDIKRLASLLLKYPYSMNRKRQKLLDIANTELSS